MLYRAGQSAAEQLGQASPEQQRAGMEQWTIWAGRAQSAIVDFGAPVTPISSDQSIGGYAILQADTVEQLQALLADHHPHRRIGTIDIHELLPPPGT